MLEWVSLGHEALSYRTLTWCWCRVIASYEGFMSLSKSAQDPQALESGKRNSAQFLQSMRAPRKRMQSPNTNAQKNSESGRGCDARNDHRTQLKIGVIEPVETHFG